MENPVFQLLVNKSFLLSLSVSALHPDTWTAFSLLFTGELEPFLPSRKTRAVCLLVFKQWLLMLLWVNTMEGGGEWRDKNCAQGIGVKKNTVGGTVCQLEHFPMLGRFPKRNQVNILGKSMYRMLFFVEENITNKKMIIVVPLERRLGTGSLRQERHLLYNFSPLKYLSFRKTKIYVWFLNS